MSNSSPIAIADSPRLQDAESAVMPKPVPYRFFAVPSHHIPTSGEAIHSDELVEPELPFVFEAIDKALSGAEYRDVRARPAARRPRIR
jgi:hypothetical protein